MSVALVEKAGKWGAYAQPRRCGKNNLCARCAEDPNIEPHGPYVTLKRSAGDASVKQEVYIGKLSEVEAAVLSGLLPMINEKWETAVPKRRTIRNLIEKEVGKL
jgi:hypothetical protein